MKLVNLLLFIILISTLVLSADLSDYPSPFIQNGNWAGLVVLGKDAAPSATLGAIDIAATISTIVDIQTDQVLDEKLVSDTQEITDNVSSKLASATSTQLKALESGKIVNDLGNFAYSPRATN